MSFKIGDNALMLSGATVKIVGLYKDIAITEGSTDAYVVSFNELQDWYRDHSLIKVALAQVSPSDKTVYNACHISGLTLVKRSNKRIPRKYIDK